MSVAAVGSDQRIEIIDAVVRADQRIGEAVIEQELAAVPVEGRQIGAGRIDVVFEEGIYDPDVEIEVEVLPLEIGTENPVQ